MIIGITGIQGSGKNTAANILKEIYPDYNFKLYSLAAPLKDAVSVLFGLPRDLLEGDTKESREWREQVIEYWANIWIDSSQPVTPRVLLQQFGTNIVRKYIDEDFWVHRFKLELLQHPDTNYLITDVRFINEAQCIKDLGGVVIRIDREPAPEWYKKALNGQEITENVHESELDIPKVQPDYILHNNGTLEDLKQEILDTVRL